MMDSVHIWIIVVHQFDLVQFDMTRSCDLLKDQPYLDMVTT